MEFGLFHKPDAIIIAHYGADLAHMPAIGLDRRWHIGREDLYGIHYAPYELE